MGRAGARVLVLLAWGSFFTWLWVTDEASRYIGSKTYWVVPFGAVAIGIAALAQVFFLIRQRGESGELSRREAAGAVLMLVPLLAVALVPRAELGSFALSRKLRQAPASAPGNVTGGATTQLRARDELGFVSRFESTPPGMFELTRFQITCCVAGAVPVLFTVDPGKLRADYPSETWVKVSGTWRTGGDKVLLVAERIEAVEAPKKRYINGG